MLTYLNATFNEEIDIQAAINGHGGLIVHVVTHGHGAFPEYILQSHSPSMNSNN